MELATGRVVRPTRYGSCVGDLVYFMFGPRRGMRRGTSAQAWYERGCALEAAEPAAAQAADPSAAKAAYGRALAGRPDHADAHNNLGRMLHECGELAAAESHYRLALCLDREVALYWFNLGVVLEDRGRAAESIAAYEQALSRDAHLADAHYNLARQIERAARDSGDEILLRRAVRHLTQYRHLSRVAGS